MIPYSDTHSLDANGKPVWSLQLVIPFGPPPVADVLDLEMVWAWEARFRAEVDQAVCLLDGHGFGFGAADFFFDGPNAERMVEAALPLIREFVAQWPMAAQATLRLYPPEYALAGEDVSLTDGLS